MILRIIAILALFGPMTARADAPTSESLTPGQPRDVVKFIQRYAGCNHFAGEEPYDKARAAEIANATQKLHCGDLAAQEKKLLKKYRKRPKTVHAIEQAKNTI
jgi:hypothetical protein